MALWSRGKSPDTSSTEDHARAHAWAKKREEKALKAHCGKCRFRKEIVFNWQPMHICTGLKPEYNRSLMAIGTIYNEGRCPIWHRPGQRNAKKGGKK